MPLARAPLSRHDPPVLPRWGFLLSILGLFALFAATYLVRPIMEPDFFWHLKTGEWIWQHHALPSADPFSFTGPQQPNARQLLILQGYWLAQLGYYAATQFFGLWGIYLLRVCLLAGFFGLFLWVFSRHQVNRLLAFSLLTLFGIFFLENYALERPQVFTFLAIGVLVIFYRWGRERFTEEARLIPPLVAMFLLLAAWSNLHGGVLLGQGAIVLMALVETCVFLKERDFRRFMCMLAFLGVGFAGSLLAPSQLGAGEVLSLMGVGGERLGISQSQTNYEYYSVFTWLFIQKNFKLLIPIALSLTCALALKEAVRQRNYVEILLLIVFWAFAYRYVRYLPIAMVFSLLFLAWHWRPDSWLRYCAVPMLAGAVLSLLLWTSNEFGHLPKARAVGLVDPLSMPEKAADFLREQRFKGKILNTINWGGYLMWRLFPDVQVAGDGRVLDLAIYEQLSRLSGGGEGAFARPLWKDFVDYYQVDVALLPLMSGLRPSLLVQGFARDPEWRLVYRDQTAAIFARNNSLPTPVGNNRLNSL